MKIDRDFEPEVPRGSNRWMTSVATSTILHLIIIGWLLGDWSRQPPIEAAPPAAMVVELAAMPSAPQADPVDAAPGPEQVQADSQPVPTKDAAFDPPPEVSPQLKPAFTVPTEKKMPSPPQRPPAAQTTQNTAPPPAPVPSVEDRKAAPNEGNNVAPPSDAEQAWEARLLARLERTKRYPPSARSAGQEDTVQMRLVIDRSGRVINATVKKSKGFALLDEEVLAAAKRASPFPPPPDDVPGAQIVRVVPVEFYIKRRR